MNDEFLRRLRPLPRAAFVHELKGRLDRLPRTRSVVGGPAYLRTLLIALLIGGAAFAVTMMSMRRESVVAHVSAPVSEAPRPADRAPGIVASSPPAKAKDGEVTPAITRAARGDSAPWVNEVASAQQERPANTARAASSEAVAAEAPASQVVGGIAVAGEGIRSIEGVGVAFPSPIYQAWSRDYLRLSGVSVDYVLVGGGGNLKLLLNRGVTFAGIDNPMSGEDLKAAGLFQFPVVAGGVVPIVHLDGVTASQIKLDGWTLARIYLGEISHWSDPPIQKLNPGLGLPNTRITLAYRLDSSVSTQLFTGYLSGYNNWFKGRYGVRTQIDVSPGAAVRGDNGMLDFVQRTDGAIGYVDYRYARQQGIESIRLINKVGNAVAATPETLQSAVSHAEWIVAPGFGASLLDLSGEKTWPMTQASFVVMQSRVNRPQTAAAVQFFDWAYRNGSKAAAEQGYVALPPAVANQVRALWANAIGRAVPMDPDTRDTTAKDATDAKDQGR